MKHTPGPWILGEYDEQGGYDCMYSGVRVGPVRLEGADYGQRSCRPMPPEGLTRMLADARLIAAAPKMKELLEEFCTYGFSREDALELLKEIRNNKG